MQSRNVRLRGAMLAAIAVAGAFWLLSGVAARSDTSGSSDAADTSASQTAQSSDSSDAKTPVDTAYLKAGSTIYADHCSACHQQNGEGVAGTFPPLADNPHLSDLKLVVHTIRDGHSGAIDVNGKSFDQTMPAIGAGFTPKQIAEVATYVRNTWGNQDGGVTTAQVEKILGSGSASGSDPKGKTTPVSSSLKSEGKQIYDEHCSPCHQTNGQGIPGTYPPLAGNEHLRSVTLIDTTEHRGHSGQITVEGKTYNGVMPPIGAGFSPEQTAAVATYVRNSWGNDFGGVTVDEIKKDLKKGKPKEK